MKNKLFLCLIVACAAMAFQGTSPVLRVYVTTGCYGGGSQVTLQLKPDGTFRYIDRTAQPVLDVRGKWLQQGHHVVLGEHNADVKIHDRWKMDREYPCLKSRKGMEWRRLCLTR